MSSSACSDLQRSSSQTSFANTSRVQVWSMSIVCANKFCEIHFFVFTSGQKRLQTLACWHGVTRVLPAGNTYALQPTVTGGPCTTRAAQPAVSRFWSDAWRSHAQLLVGELRCAALVAGRNLLLRFECLVRGASIFAREIVGEIWKHAPCDPRVLETRETKPCTS